MTTWTRFTEESPDLAAAVRTSLEAFRHHVLATLDAAGAPRVSGTEVQFFDDDLVAGMMPGARKSADLHRDGRFALHANPGDGTMASGDAKLSGVAEPLDDPAVLERFRAVVGAAPGPFELFRLSLDRVVRTTLHPDGDRLVIETWHPGGPSRAVERR